MTANQTIDGVPRVILNSDREMRVYIAGPMTGIADYNFPAFNAMADKMRAAGWHVENPADHGLVDGADWADYLRYDIGCLASCEAIMLLPGWTASRGARLEVSIAKELGVVFMFADGAEREPAAQPHGEPVAMIREQFEAWADSNGYDITRNEHGDYSGIVEDSMWTGFQARDYPPTIIDRARRFVELVAKCVRNNGEYAPLHLQEMEELDRDLRLYAEQPAPVAVVKKFCMRSVMEIVEALRLPVMTSNQCHALAMKLNACHDEATNLDGQAQMCDCNQGRMPCRCKP